MKDMPRSTHAAPGALALLTVFIAIVAIVAMAGCDRHHEGSTNNSSATWEHRDFPSGITGYNHTDNTIASFDVDGVWGGNVRPHTGGGSSACCVQLPLPWHEGLTVKIDWEDDKGQQHERVVPVPRYDAKSLGIFNVHFLRSGEVKVFDLNGGLGSPDYPFQGDEADLKPGIPNFQYPRPPSAVHQKAQGASS
jgi:hypothetical protein